MPNKVIITFSSNDKPVLVGIYPATITADQIIKNH